jgi:hypothetical protein
VVGVRQTDKGKPVASRGRKTRGLSEAAQLPKGAHTHMSQFRRSVAVAATLAAVVALPATASAKPATVSKKSVAAVQKSVTNAQTAVKRLKRAVRLGQPTLAKRQLKVARSQTATASRTARRMATVATTDSATSTAAQALTIAGTQYDDLLEALTALVDDGPAQSLIAGAIEPTIAGKEQILTMLTSMLADVPASVQPTLASIIAALGAGDATEVVNLDSALNAGNLPGTITGLVTQCLDMAMAAIQNALAMVQGFLPMLPVGAQAPIGTILTQITGIVGDLVPSVLSTITGLIDTIIGSLPVVGGGTSGGGPLGGLLGGIVGGAPGAGTGNVPGVGNVSNMISDLLGGLLGGATGGGTGSGPVGGIISTVTGLINSLLGGLLGGVVPAT